MAAQRPRRLAARRALARLGGARLCYGKPVTQGDRTVIPVARLRFVGGGGFGAGPDPDQEGAGGGGIFDAAPIGFIELDPEGSRFVPIRDPERTARTVRATAGTIGALAVSAAAARAVYARVRRPSRALGRRSPPRWRPR